MIKNINSIELTEKNYNEIVELYNQLSLSIDKDHLTIDKMAKIISNIKDNHYIFVYVVDNKIIGAITLFIEQKIIHNGKCVGHIEDVVVHQDYRNNNIASLLLDHAIEVSKKGNCYKCILDCIPELEKFYGKKGFKNKGSYMGLYF